MNSVQKDLLQVEIYATREEMGLAVGAELMAQYGPDSPIGRTTAVMLGSTETTFYAISVYFGAAGVKRSRYAVPAALLADFTGFVMASLTVRFL